MKRITLTETTGGSFKCVLPKELVLKLKWQHGDMLEVTEHGGKMRLKKEVKNDTNK